MNCKKIKPLLMGLLDGELSQDEQQQVEKHLELCEECSSEMASFKKIEEVAMGIKFVEPTQEAWKVYWSSVYNQLERKISWILISLGIIILSSYSIYKLLEDVFLNATIPWIVKGAIAALILGVVTLTVSVIRERIALAKHDKYKEVMQ